MAFGMAYRVRHCIWYGLACLHGIRFGLTIMAWYMIWPCRHGMVSAVAWWAWRDIWYCLVGLAWYMVCPCGHGMVYGIA